MVVRAEEVFWMSCPRCENEWAPKASRWKNLNNVIRTGRKAVYCPACNKRVLLTKKDTAYLIGQKRSTLKKVKKHRRLRKHAKKSKHTS